LESAFTGVNPKTVKRKTQKIEQLREAANRVGFRHFEEALERVKGRGGDEEFIPCLKGGEAEPTASTDRGRKPGWRGILSPQRPRLLSCGVRRSGGTAMCLAVYVASDHALPTVAYDPARPAFYVEDVTDCPVHNPLRAHFRQPFLYAAGPHSGCGSAFHVPGF